MALRGSTKLLVANVPDWEVERETVSTVNTPPYVQMMMVMKTEMCNDLLIINSKAMKSCTHQIKSRLFQSSVK
jgi:hypothetical protein